MIRTPCLYWLLQCVRNGFFKVEVIGVSGCDLRVSQGDWRSLMLAPPRASFLRHGWLHHHFSICCPFVKTLSGLCNFGHSYWRAICPTEHFTGFGHFNMLLGFSYIGKLFLGKLSLTHMYLLLTMWWHLMLCIYVLGVVCGKHLLVSKKGMYLSWRTVCASLQVQERKEVCDWWSVWLLFSLKMGVVPTKITCKAPSNKTTLRIPVPKGTKAPFFSPLSCLRKYILFG